MRVQGVTAGPPRVIAVATALLVVALAGCSSSGSPTTAPTTAHEGMLLTCSEGGPTFPPSALRSRPTADQGNGALAVALRDVVATSPAIATAGSTPRGWRMLYDTGSLAGFLSEPTDAMPGGLFLELSKTGGTWHFSDSDGCNREVWRPGVVAGQWAVDPAYGFPKAADTQIHIVVGDPECNDGKVLTRDRIHSPVVTWTGGTVTLAMYLTPVSAGMHACPAPVAPSGQTGIDHIAAVAYTVDLGRPLGPRHLLDGSIYPPRPPNVGTR